MRTIARHKRAKQHRQREARQRANEMAANTHKLSKDGQTVAFSVGYDGVRIITGGTFEDMSKEQARARYAELVADGWVKA